MKKNKIFILFITIAITLTGCKSAKNQSVKFEKKDKAPNSLKDISSGLQDILKSIEKVEKILDGTYIQEKPKEDKQKPQDSKGGDGASSGTNSGSQGGGSSSSQDGNTGQGTEGVTITIEEKKKNEEERKEKNKEELLKNWEKIDKKIEDIHKKWNEYEPESMKKGATTEKTDNFRLSLNSLTKATEKRNIKEIYDYGSKAMLNLVPIQSLYRDDIGGEINKIKYATYQSYINAIEGKKAKASELLKNVDEDINKMRLKFEKDDAKVKILEKVNLSIEDMRKSLTEESVKLTRIKRDIIIDNLGELEK